MQKLLEMPSKYKDMTDYYPLENAHTWEPDVQDPREVAKGLTDDQLMGLRVMLANEARRRRDEVNATVRKIKAKARLAECAESLSHLFSNIAHAMACRTALRWASGNKPYTGKGPTKGTPWNPADGAKVQMLHESGAQLDGMRLYWNPLHKFKSYDEASNTMRHGLLEKAWSWSPTASEAF